MQTETITLKEYCDLADYSFESNWVQKKLRAGIMTVGMVSYKKFGNAYAITVLKSWKDGKEGKK